MTRGARLKMALLPFPPPPGGATPLYRPGRGSAPTVERVASLPASLPSGPGREL